MVSNRANAYAMRIPWARAKNFYFGNIYIHHSIVQILWLCYWYCKCTYMWWCKYMRWCVYLFLCTYDSVWGYTHVLRRGYLRYPHGVSVVWFRLPTRLCAKFVRYIICRGSVKWFIDRTTRVCSFFLDCCMCFGTHTKLFRSFRVLFCCCLQSSIESGL